MILLLAVIGYLAGRRKAISMVQGNLRQLQALPQAYGQTVFFTTFLPAMVILLGWAFVVRIMGPSYALVSDGQFQAFVIFTAAAGLMLSYSRTKPSQRARAISERWIMGLLMAASALAILTTSRRFDSIMACLAFSSPALALSYNL